MNSEPHGVIDAARLASDPKAAIAAMCSEDGAILLVDKPFGETSFYVVTRIRKAITMLTGIRKIKVGHAGTLDPLADGLLIIATRRKTKTLAELTGMDKTYLLELRFGISSPSFDLERPIEIVGGESGITLEALKRAVRSFDGVSMQVPPIYSAIKQDGRPVYHLARKGEEPTMTSREITILESEVVSYEPPHACIRIRCSKGTYVRSLVRDIGLALGTGAVLTALRREAISEMTLDRAMSLNDILAALKSLTVELV